MRRAMDAALRVLFGGKDLPATAGTCVSKLS